MEWVIHRIPMSWLIENKKHHFYQTVFRTHHSTTDQLFYLSQSIIDSFHEKLHKKTLAVFRDISAAFDRVWRQILVHTVQSTGINGKALLWINDFLRGRKFSVRFNGALSESRRIWAGVSQGSVLSPLLFLIFMNTIYHHIHPDTKIACYADDIAVWHSHNDITESEKALNTTLKEYATPIWTPASISVKRKLDSVQHRAAKIIIGAVSSTNNEKAEQECGLPPLESRHNLATIKFTNKLRSYGLDHISRRVFEKWKNSTRLKRSSTLQLDSKIRKELNLEHSSLEFLQETLIPKIPPKNTCFELELLQPCSKKEDPVTLRQKGIETIEILSQDNFAITYTDGSSDRSFCNGCAGIILLLPDGSNYKHKTNTGIIASNVTSELMAIREALIFYQQDPHVIDSTEGLVNFSDSKSAIEAIRNGETNISFDIITLLEQLHSKRKSCNGYPHMSTLRIMNVPIVSPKKLETSIISAPPSHDANAVAKHRIMNHFQKSPSYGI
ncbi:probable RNA-directed DNA polymerase from transposon BS [Trichonephila clavipes]|nr:probable RNA-directed DNA polymerase from transposon BS [Trichonephila clavipes]